MVVGFWHRVKNPCIRRQPSGYLFTTHCVGIRIFKFHGFWTIQFSAPLVFVVLNMKCVNKKSSSGSSRVNAKYISVLKNIISN